MPDGRIVEFVLPCAMIDNYPEIASGLVTGMCIVRAEPRLAETAAGEGVDCVWYQAWHKRAPPIALTLGGKPTMIDFEISDIKGDAEGRVFYHWHRAENVASRLWSGMMVLAQAPKIVVSNEEKPQ